MDFTTCKGGCFRSQRNSLFFKESYIFFFSSIMTGNSSSGKSSSVHSAEFLLLLCQLGISEREDLTMEWSILRALRLLTVNRCPGDGEIEANKTDNDKDDHFTICINGT